MRDLLSGVQHVHLGTLTLTGATPASSAWVDTQGWDGAMLVVSNAVITAAGSTGYVAAMQHSDSTLGTSAAAVAAGDSVNGAISVAAAAPTSNTLAGALGYLGSRRYVRMTLTGSSGTNATVSIFAVVRKAAREPATFIGASVAAT